VKKGEKGGGDVGYRQKRSTGRKKGWKNFTTIGGDVLVFNDRGKCEIQGLDPGEGGREVL